MPQFFVNQKLSPPCKIELKSHEAHHVCNVLRLKAGDWIRLSDGQGRTFKGVIERSSGKSVVISVELQIETASNNEPPVIAISVFKSDRFEMAVQKTVELGCRRIIPVIAERCISHLAKAAEEKIERWNKIALEAAKQSGLPFVPAVDHPLPFAHLCSAEIKFDEKAMLYEGKAALNLREYFKSSKESKKHLVIIGPEGGFTSGEVELAIDSGIKTVSMGVQILRVETAAIAAVSIWQYEFGNMG